ncbi:MAG TPA: hypothetical protein PLU81_03090, partial [Deltaproteobacteria bacterium]|nr:hypothetical protein [Deltaproteobacteria bacterium]HPR50746.1 hypothetical protein [Deltaproteobacteria bacterium]
LGVQVPPGEPFLYTPTDVTNRVAIYATPFVLSLMVNMAPSVEGRSSVRYLINGVVDLGTDQYYST